MNYNANQSAVMTPDHSVFFTITTESINEMLQLQPSQSITPLSVGDLFNRFPKLTLIKVARLYQTFIREEKYIMIRGHYCALVGIIVHMAVMDNL